MEIKYAQPQDSVYLSGGKKGRRTGEMLIYVKAGWWSPGYHLYYL